MGGSSVPSTTTQTQMLDPTRQKALQQAIGSYNKWADNYTGQSYPGQRVAGRTQDWYSAQRMAHNLASRFADGGITNIKRFDDGGTTPAPTNSTPSTDAGANAGNPFLQAENQTQYGTGAAYGMANENWQPNQISSTYTPGTYTAGTITPENISVDKMANPDMWNTEFMQKYMSPYTQGVVDIAKREADRQYQQELQKQKSQATTSGAFGGYRQGVVEAEGARNQSQLLNDIQTKGMQDAYANAVTQFNADRQALMDTGRFNATQAYQIASANATNKLAADTTNQANASNAFNLNQADQQTAAKMAAETAQGNINNVLAARAARLNAINQGIAGASQLANIEGAYNTANINAANELYNTDASARAATQAQIDDMIKAWDKLQGTELEKAQMLAQLIGTMPGGATSVKVGT